MPFANSQGTTPPHSRLVQKYGVKWESLAFFIRRSSAVKSSRVQSPAGKSAPARRSTRVLRYMSAALNSIGSWNRLPSYIIDSTSEGWTSAKYSFSSAASRRTHRSSGTPRCRANNCTPSVAT